MDPPDIAPLRQDLELSVVLHGRPMRFASTWGLLLTGRIVNPNSVKSKEEPAIAS